jgi:PAS domain-containing protein
VEGVIISFNRGAQQSLGYAAAELLGKQTPGLWHDGAEVAARGKITYVNDKLCAISKRTARRMARSTWS